MKEGIVAKEGIFASPLRERDWPEVERSFHQTSPFNYAVLDDFFTESAFDALRQGLLAHWGWSYLSWEAHEIYIRNFENAVLQGVIDGLKHNLPSVLDKHDCVTTLAFLYIQNTGLYPHSDLASVSVNTWMTPDEFNLDPETGGMVLFDVKRTEDMMVHEFNAAPYCVDYFKSKTQGQQVVIPYRCNRTVLFDSRTFHASDRLRFKNTDSGTTRMNFGLSFDDPERYRTKFEPYAYTLYEPLKGQRSCPTRQGA